MVEHNTLRCAGATTSVDDALGVSVNKIADPIEQFLL